MDLCTPAHHGTASDHCDTALALSGLSDAVARHRPAPGLVHHTNRGSTYTAGDYRRALENHEMVVRMSGKGTCWDNAVGESTIGFVKTEALGDHAPADIHELRRILFGYIEGFYNQRRLHSSLDYKSPVEKERELLNEVGAP